MKAYKNLLDFKPKKNPLIKTLEKEQLLTLVIPRTTAFDKIAQVIFTKPKQTYLYLDEIGSFVWTNINGENSIYEIGKSLKLKFGSKTEPLYPRLARFILSLKRNGLIKL